MNIPIKSMHLTPNPYSRPRVPLKTITKLVIHWVGNPGSTALANRNYFESLKSGKKGIYASSHYIVGLEGEILLCIPHTEIAYHAKSANHYSLGIETCHPNWEGQFNSKTYVSLVNLCSELCKLYNLNPLTDLLRHYDVTGKDCPKYYVNHPQYWAQFKKDVQAALQGS